VPPRRSTFIDEIIRKDESQALVGPRKGSTRIPQATNSPTATHVEVHSGTEGAEQSFQNTHTPPLNPLDKGNSCNLEEGEGETSGIVEANPSPEPGSLVILIGEGTPEIPDIGNTIKSPKGPNNQPPQIEHPNQEIPEGYWCIWDQMAHPNQPWTQNSTLEYPIVDLVANAPVKAIPLHNLPTFHGLISEDPYAFLFKFDVLCRGYDYTSEPQKLKLFPST
jgi:hypothetical protein